jgi:hypothetical protein
MNAPICESYLRFDLPHGSQHHEDVNPNGPGVDFEIAATPPVWLEVKNWDAPVIPAEQRPKSDRDYLSKTKSASSFWGDIVAKFEGTHDCLQQVHARPRYLVLALLLESRLFSETALAPAISILEALVATSQKVGGSGVAVFNAASLSKFVPSAKATPCDVGLFPQHVCRNPVDRCSVERRKHSGTAP